MLLHHFGECWVSDNYFFFDGSALCAQIRTLWKRDRAFEGRKLDAIRYVTHLQRANSLTELHGGNFKRATFYFPKGDEDTAAKHLMMPKLNTPGLVRDTHFKYCGEKLKRSKTYAKWVETDVPQKWRDRVSKSEKGVDIEICCDALRLVSVSKLDRLFLLTNDADFVPLCKTLKDLGTNVSLIYLSEFQAPNKALLDEVDTYDVVPVATLQTLFDSVVSSRGN
jgi:uncharacterized LabA/DUF88 family protein